jgi:plasmid stabilization system protein ParE
MTVYWSSNAKRNYFKIVDYLLENWTLKEIENFQFKLSNLISKIQNNPNFCPHARYSQLRLCLINKQNSLVYLVENQTLYLFIVDLVDNRSEHSY